MKTFAIGFAFLGWPEIIVILLLLGIPLGAALLALVIYLLVNRSRREKAGPSSPLPPPPEK